jgi:hypothetical protein
MLGAMRSRVGICILAVSGIASIGCGSSKSSGRYDASAAGQGGSVGNGGVLGSGGVAATGGTGSLVAGGTSGTVASGTGGSGSGGVASGTGGRNAGGSATGGATTVGSGGATTVGSGGARTGGSVGVGGGGRGGVLGSGGSGAGGIASGGASGPATGGAGGGKDAGADAAGGAPGIDGAGTAVYSGCWNIGGITRACVAKFDPQLGACALIELFQPGSGDAGVGLTVSGLGWGVGGIYLWWSPTNDCLRMGRAGVNATSASGTVTVVSASQAIDVDAVLNFPSSDAGPAMTVEMKATGVTINHSCTS